MKPAGPILTGKFSEKTYERGFILGAISGLYTMPFRVNADPEPAAMAAAMLSSWIVGDPLEGEGKVIIELLVDYIEAQNEAIRRYRDGRQEV